MTAHVHTLPVLRDNFTFFLTDTASGHTAIIDPGEAKPVIDFVKKSGLIVTHILNTHHHHDHIGGNAEIKCEFNTQVICSHHDKPRVKDATSSVGEGNSIFLGSTEIQVLETPGHTLGHLSFFAATAKAVFTGDTLFSLGCGRLFEGTAMQMLGSLRRIAELPRDTKVYCGHEYTINNAMFALDIDPHNDALQKHSHIINQMRSMKTPTIPSTIETEVQCNPFLRPHHLAEALGMAADSNPLDVFTELRMRKDSF